MKKLISICFATTLLMAMVACTNDYDEDAPVKPIRPNTNLSLDSAAFNDSTELSHACLAE